jgi:hypothetical protein
MWPVTAARGALRPARIVNTFSFVVPPHILDELLRRERERTRSRTEDERPRLELPLPPRPPTARSCDDDDAGRGLVVIDLFG